MSVAMAVEKLAERQVAGLHRRMRDLGGLAIESKQIAQHAQK